MSRNTLIPSALYWALFNRFELRLSGECVEACAHSGRCDADVAYWTPRVIAQVETDNFRNKPTADKIRAELKEYGAWSEKELADENANWRRLIWSAANNISEEESPDCSEPIRD